MEDKEFWPDDVTPDELSRQVELYHKSIIHSDVLCWATTYNIITLEHILNNTEHKLGNDFYKHFNVLDFVLKQYEQYKKTGPNYKEWKSIDVARFLVLAIHENKFSPPPERSKKRLLEKTGTTLGFNGNRFYKNFNQAQDEIKKVYFKPVFNDLAPLLKNIEHIPFWHHILYKGDSF